MKRGPPKFSTYATSTRLKPRRKPLITPRIKPGTTCAFSKLRPGWKHGGRLQRCHIIRRSHVIEQWPLAWFWGCAYCHDREHTEGGITRAEMWTAKGYTKDELVLLILLGLLAADAGVSALYDQVMERASWAANQSGEATCAAKIAVKRRGAARAVAGYLNKLKHQRPVPKWVREAMRRA